MIPIEPDQSAELWSRSVAAYETVFEPFTQALAAPALRQLAMGPGARVLDVAAGPGGLALAMARSGAIVSAVDFSPSMVARIAQRASKEGIRIDARAMDAMRLGYDDGVFDAAISVFGVVLVPDAAAAVREMARTVRPGGSVAVVTWTEPQRYELAATLTAAADQVWPDRPKPGLPAQLRFREQPAFEALFREAGLPLPRISTVEAQLVAPGARWLADRIAFAPGLAAFIDGLGDRRGAILEAFVERLRAKFGDGPVSLGGVAFAGVAVR